MSYNPSSANPQTSTSSGVITLYTNASASVAIPQGMAVSINGAGLIVPLDVSSQSNWNGFVGYAYARIPASATGPVIASGRLLNFTTAFAVGTPLYIGIDGNPTNIVPSVGVNGFISGYLCMFLGVLVPNAINPLELDIALFTQEIGTL